MIAECIVCAYEMDGKERVPSLGACGHNSMCSLCTLRIRALHRNVNCVTCKRELEHVICSDKPEAKFEDFPMWGDSIGPEFVLDQKSQMFFPSQYYKDVIQKLWVHKCKICSHTFRDIKSLRAHVSGEHNMHICLHCVENKHDFPAEQKVYTQKQYETHLRQGDQDGSLGHPNCEFCRKRYYDAQALFVHLNKDHYNCHLCEKAGIKFKYFKDYKHMEEHFQKAHILCDDPVCLAKKFVVFDNEIDFEVHNRKYHPTFAIKRASTIKLDFKVARNTTSNNNNNSSNNNNREEEVTKESGEEDHSSGADHRSNSRYEAGFGGRARDGEWQVELQPISSDPRDINRNAHIVVGSTVVNNTSSSENALAEEFPTLPTSTSTGTITLTNKWVSMGTAQGGARRPKKNDFPALQSSTKKTTLSAKLGGGSSNMNSSGIGSIQREYDSMGNVISGTVGTSQRAVTANLGDWARIKVDKKSGAKASITTTNTNSTSSSSAKQYTGYYSAQPPEVGYEESLAMALAESLNEAHKSGAGSSNCEEYTTVPHTKPYALPTPPPPSSDAYPTLSSTTTTTANTSTNTSTKNASAKKKAPAAGGWNDALLAMGMNTSSSKKVVVKNKLSVIKAVPSDGSLSKLDTSSGASPNVGSSTTNRTKWDNMKPVTKSSEDEYRIGSGKTSPVPPTPPANTTSTTSTTSTNDKKYGNWVKMGGATNGSIPSQLANSGAESADFPSLGSAKRTK